MRFSLRQILASSLGAVIAALIASSFGVTGTIVGVAIGAAVATTATALVSQSIERGHAAVRQVVQAPESTPLLRRLGATGPVGATASPERTGSAPATGGHDTVAMAAGAEATSETQRLEITAATSAPAAERLRATSSVPTRPPGRARPGTARGLSWKAVAAAIGVVFLLSLGFITAVELISGKPLADIFGNAGTGPTILRPFDNQQSTTTTTTTTTPPTTTTTTAPTTTSTSGTTSTTLNGSASTTTTRPASSTTTTTGAGSATTTTTRAGGAP